MAQVTYTVDLIPENAEKIDAVNQILIGDYSKPAKTTSKKPSKTSDDDTDDADTLTLDDVKKAAKASKKEHGEDFTLQVIKDSGTKPAATLGKTMSKIDADDYAEIIAAWSAGPSEDNDGLGDDDDFGEDEEDADIDPEAVQTALKAYAKSEGRDEAKALLKKHKVGKLSEVADLSQKKLAALLKAVV